MNEVGWLGGRLPMLIFFAATLVAIALLIAGYGVPVGVGALVGLLLGLALGSSMFVWLARSTGRSVSIHGMPYFRPDGEGEGQWAAGGGSMQSAEFGFDMSSMADVVAVDQGRVLSVVPIMQAADGSGLRLQLVSLERREAGLALMVDVKIWVGARQPGALVRATLSDDVGTRYQAFGDQHGGAPSSLRYSIAGVPAIPRDATRLTVRIDAFSDPFPPSERRVIGPWEFQIPLG